MNVRCTHCNTVFRVDPRKVPAAGVRVRCSICRGVFLVAHASTPPPAEAASPPAPEAVSEPVREAAPAAAATPQPAPAPEADATEAIASPAPHPEAAPLAPEPPPVATAAPAPAPSPAAAPRPGGSPFGASDPAAKARRLARALVSDIVTYHPERRDRALAEGTLKREFMEEIKKSWEEFVGQVGAETARGAPHFRDALNDILAKGERIF
jgi:predicted Zn finger-like uncharacterized protein